MVEQFKKEEFISTLKLIMDNQSQKDFAEHCGVSREFLNRMINGKIKNKPSLTTVKKISMMSDDPELSRLIYLYAGHPYDDNVYKNYDDVAISIKQAITNNFNNIFNIKFIFNDINQVINQLIQESIINFYYEIEPNLDDINVENLPYNREHLVRIKILIKDKYMILYFIIRYNKIDDSKNIMYDLSFDFKPEDYNINSKFNNNNIKINYNLIKRNIVNKSTLNHDGVINEFVKLIKGYGFFINTELDIKKYLIKKKHLIELSAESINNLTLDDQYRFLAKIIAIETRIKYTTFTDNKYPELNNTPCFMAVEGDNKGVSINEIKIITNKYAKEINIKEVGYCYYKDIEKLQEETAKVV